MWDAALGGAATKRCWIYECLLGFPAGSVLWNKGTGAGACRRPPAPERPLAEIPLDIKRKKGHSSGREGGQMRVPPGPCSPTRGCPRWRVGGQLTSIRPLGRGPVVLGWEEPHAQDGRSAPDRTLLAPGQHPSPPRQCSTPASCSGSCQVHP